MMSAPPAKKDYLTPGELVFSDSIIYLVEAILGEGTFGKVAKCKRMNDLTTVAIKSIKEDHLVWLARKEVDALLKLKKLDQEKCNIVQWYRAFSDRGHFCLEFELLDKSLFDFMQQRSFRPLFVREIRPIVQQLANALKHLKSVGMIHADIKLENVMLVNHGLEPYKVKLIDFGLACETSAASQGSYIQTRVYRSPEIMLAIPFTEAIDMWSLGCLAAELYLGTLLYPGINEYDMMRLIVATQGLPPDTMLNAGHKTSCFFEKESNSWKLKTPEKYYKEAGTKFRESRQLRFNSLDSLMHVRPVNHYNSVDKIVKTADQIMFVDLVKKMLQLDGTQRIAPSQVLEHDFITCQIARTYPRNFYVQACSETMNVCLTPGTAAQGALQNPSFRTMHPIQQSCPPPPLPPPADMTKLDTSECIKPQACPTLPTEESAKSGKRRKSDQKVENPSDRVLRKTKSSMQSVAGPSTPSASQDPSSCTQASTTARSPAAPLQCGKSTNPACTPQRVKRKIAPNEGHSFQERFAHELKRVRKQSKAQATGSESSSSTPHSQPDGKTLPVPHIQKVNWTTSTQTESVDCTGSTAKAAEGDDSVRPTDPQTDNSNEEEKLREPHVTQEDTEATSEI